MAHHVPLAPDDTYRAAQYRSEQKTSKQNGLAGINQHLLKAVEVSSEQFGGGDVMLDGI